VAVSANNRKRYRAILISREVKALFAVVPERVASFAGRWLAGWLLRWMFLGADGKPHRGGEIVLAEIRRLTLLERTTIFDPDPVVMAYREGKRAVGVQIMALLNLNEQDVQKLMEIDDGLGQ
jgi:hypothetical protein